MKNILVIFGGNSSEHDISVITGVLCLNGTDKTKYNAIPVYVDKDGLWYCGEILKNVENYKNLDFKKLFRVTLISGSRNLYTLKKRKLKELGEISLAINCLHGINGEDGSLAGMLNMCKIPLASPDIYMSSVGMDKGLCKDIARAHFIRTLKYVGLSSEEYFSRQNECEKRIADKIGFPMIIKPSHLGSSIGITVANDIKELKEGLYKAFRLDYSCIIEPKLTNFQEVNCACYTGGNGLVVSEVTECFTQNSILTFEDKYGGEAQSSAADLPENIIKKVKDWTVRIYRLLKGEGVIRVDYLIKDGTVYFNEINTVPGSLAYYFFCDGLSELPEFLNDIYARAFKVANARSGLCTEFDSDVLTISGVKGKGGRRIKS